MNESSFSVKLTIIHLFLGFPGFIVVGLSLFGLTVGFENLTSPILNKISEILHITGSLEKTLGLGAFLLCLSIVLTVILLVKKNN